MTYLYLCIILCGMGLFSVAMYLASKNGSKAAQLAALKSELRKLAEEEARAKRINQSVANFSNSDISNKLHQIANEQSKRM